MRTEQIRIRAKTKVMLDNLKVHKNQSYDEVIYDVIGTHAMQKRCEAFKDVDAMVK